MRLATDDWFSRTHFRLFRKVDWFSWRRYNKPGSCQIFHRLPTSVSKKWPSRTRYYSKYFWRKLCPNCLLVATFEEIILPPKNEIKCFRDFLYKEVLSFLIKVTACYDQDSDISTKLNILLMVQTLVQSAPQSVANNGVVSKFWVFLVKFRWQVC